MGWKEQPVFLKEPRKHSIVWGTSQMESEMTGTSAGNKVGVGVEGSYVPTSAQICAH